MARATDMNPSATREGHDMVKFRNACCASLLILIGPVLAACSRNESDIPAPIHATTLQTAMAKKKIRVGYANEAPYAFQESASGKLTGEAPEIARVVLGKLGITEVEGVLTEFSALIPGLQAKRFDMIAAGMYILPERCKQIAFSNPTYSAGEAFAVRAGNPLALHGYADISSRPEARLGVVAGAVEASYARELGIRKEQVTIFPDGPSALEGIGSGRIDAYAATRPTIAHFLEKNPEGLEIATPFANPTINGRVVRGYGAFGFRKDDQDLVDAFNVQLKNFIGSPEHLKLVGGFGFDAQNLPGEASADELCQPPAKS